MGKDDRVKEILERYGEDMSATWVVQGQRVIYHQAVERIAAKAGITFEEPTVLRAERDEAVILVRGRMGERWDYDIGEALVGVNYRISGRQAAYVYAMGLKRGRDRLILKLVGLHGLVYSEDEADDFKDSAPPANDRRAVMQEAINANVTVPMEDGEVSPFNAMRRSIDEKMTVTALTEFMLKPEIGAAIAAWSPEEQARVKEYARNRLVALGWKTSRGSR